MSAKKKKEIAVAATSYGSYMILNKQDECLKVVFSRQEGLACTKLESLIVRLADLKILIDEWQPNNQKYYIYTLQQESDCKNSCNI